MGRLDSGQSGPKDDIIAHENRRATGGIGITASGTEIGMYKWRQCLTYYIVIST